jgi:hypothetical protein
MEDDYPRLVNEQPPDEVVAHTPELGELVHAEVPLEGSLTSCHAVASRVVRGKTRDKAEPPELLEELRFPTEEGSILALQGQLVRVKNEPLMLDA